MSTIAEADAAGAMLAINAYDEYGVPAASNIGRFQYTGQMWLSEVGAYDYKARMYAPHLGRFLQPDPIGYSGGANLYSFVDGDPVNFVDPLGLQPEPPPPPEPPPSDIIVTGKRLPKDKCPPRAEACYPATFRGLPGVLVISRNGSMGFASGKNAANRQCSLKAAVLQGSAFIVGTDMFLHLAGASMVAGEVAAGGIGAALAGGGLAALAIGTPILLAASAITVGAYKYDQQQNNKIAKKFGLC